MQTNGHLPGTPQPAAAVSRTQLREAKRKNAYLREQIVARGLERSSKLMESFGNFDWVNVYSDMLDRFRNTEPASAGISSVADRRYGMNYPLFRNETELARLRMPSRILCATNNYAIGLLTGLTSYVIGAGYDYRAAAMAGMEDVCPKELIQTCQHILDDFAKLNDWQGGEQPGIEEELFWRSCEDGEFFLRLFPQEDGRTKIRTVEPEQVTQPPGSDPDEGMFGVITPKDDAQDVKGYYVFYGTNPAGGKVINHEEIVHLRRNVKRSIKRGMPDFSFDSYDTLLLASKLRRALGIGASIQASIAWVEQHEVASKETVASALDAIDSLDFTQTNPNTGKTERVNRMEPGTKLDISKGQTYVPPPGAANAAAHLQVLQMLAQCGGNRWNAPAWLATADNTSANYATALTEESPFVKTVVRAQTAYKGAFGRPYWFALKHFVETRGGIEVNVKRGETVEQRRYSWDDIKKLIDIQVEAHSPEVRNKMEEAQANQIRVQGGWKSRQTVQMEEGLDGDREETNILEWNEKMGPGDMLPPAGGGSPFGPQQGGGLEPRPTPESRLIESKDAKGHEHAADGKFGSGGTKKADQGDKPKHGSRAAELQAAHAELKQKRLDTFNAIKADAHAASAKADEAKSQIVKAGNGLAWDSEDEDSQAFTDLDEAIVNFDPVDGEASASEKFAAFKEIEQHARAALAVKQAENGDITKDDIKANKASLKQIVEHARAARDHLREYVNHRREMHAIKTGEPMDIKESMVADSPDEEWSHLLESFDEGKVKRDGGKFAKTAGATARKVVDHVSHDLAELGKDLGELAQLGKAALSGAHALEHGAKELITSQVAKLPSAIRLPVVGVFKASYATYLAAAVAVDAVAKERGFTDAQRSTLSAAVATADVVLGMKIIPAALSATGAGAAAAGAASFVPVASLAYLAYSTAKDPSATYRAAKGAIAGLLRRKPDAG